MTQLTHTHEEFMNWLRGIYPGHELREFTDGWGAAVEVIEPRRDHDFIVTCFPLPATVWHDPIGDELHILPPMSRGATAA